MILMTEYSDSHALQLAFRLLAAGIIERGAFTCIAFQHDDHCKALRWKYLLFRGMGGQ